MKKNEYPRLCGGTFFVLLLEAVKQRTKARDRDNGGTDGLNDKDMLIGLIRLAQADYINPGESTFKQNTSAYKSCNISKGIYLPFDDDMFVSTFDDQIKNEYSTTLSTMSDFTETFIDIGSSDKHVHLVKALFELIITDESIANSDLFYIASNGSPVTKADFHGLTDICLHSFLLGIWHFIIVERKDNKIGRATFENWHTAPITKGVKWVYCSSIGDSLAQELNVVVSTVNLVDSDNLHESDYEYHTESSKSDFDEEKEPVGTLTINNNGVLLQQFGTNNKQIVGRIETLIINND